MTITAKYTPQQLQAEIQKVILQRARGETVSIDKMEELLLDADMYLQVNVKAYENAKS